jgi:anti-sigma-K factor RskA
VTDRTPQSDAELAQLSGAYALGALGPEEAAEFESYMAKSPELRWEVNELTDTAVELGLATSPVEPSAALKASIMDEISRTPQLPALPALSIVGHDAERDIDAEPIDAPTEAPAPSAAQGADLRADLRADLGAGERKAQVRWFASPLTAIVAVAAVVGLVVGGGILSNVVSDGREQSVQADRLAAINSADDRQQAVAEVTGGGTATLVWSDTLLASAVMVDGMAPLPDSKVYELWYIGETGPRPAGTFTVDEAGTSWRVLDGDMQAGDAVGVTIEPRGGSEQPTTDPVVAITSA